MTPGGARNIEALALAARAEGETELTLCLASEGGDVNAGVGLFNFLKMLPMTVNTHAAGICASIAATVLLAGQKRTAQPLSSFIVHQATFVDGPLQGQRSPNTDLISHPFKEILNWTDLDISERFGPSDFIFGPEKALEYGMVMEILTPEIGDDDRLVTVAIP
jgi:ATP-dependent protease ClpP protease subunit